MLLIEGAVRVLPVSIAAEGGVLQQNNQKESAVILFIQTSSGELQVILPPENIDAIIEAIQKAKIEAEATPKSDLVIANDMAQADAEAQTKTAIDKNFKG